jgi:hypothetical protein
MLSSVIQVWWPVIMPRQARIDAPGAVHRIILWGIERLKLFRSDSNRADSIERLAATVTKTHTSRLAWALLSNHGHPQLRTGRRAANRQGDAKAPGRRFRRPEFRLIGGQSRRQQGRLIAEKKSFDLIDGNA